MDKCFIVRYTLGAASWYLVESNGRALSVPFESFSDATAWLKGLGFRIGCARITDDLTEVTVTPIEETSQNEPEWCFDRSTGLMGFKR